MPAWKKDAGILVSEAGGIKGMIKGGDAYVLVDLRDPAAAASGYIPGAVSLPRGELAGAKERFPAKKSAPVILYSDGQAEVKDFKVVRGWGYKNASVLRGGLKGWNKSEGKVLTGDLPTDIVYVKRLKPTQIGTSEFRTIVDSPPADKLVLDVREGTSPGVLPGAKVIPQSRLMASLDQLPKEKEIVIHCNTGILASMAQKELQGKGYTARYLDAVVQVSADGSYEITEK
jgi:rhodanese-related sulfurtransferase